MREYSFGQIGVTIQDRKGARKITIRVDHGGVVVTKPRWVSRRDAERFLHDSRPWIEAQVLARPVSPVDKVLFRGEWHAIRVASCPPVRLSNSELWAHGSSDAERVAHVLEWMRRRSKPVLREALSRWSPTLGVAPKRIGVRDQVSRWGSCSSTGTLSFNWRLIMAPPAVLEYIVVHELAHLIEHNHSRRFWSVVSSHMPNYRDHEVWLDENGETLLAFGRSRV